MYTSLHSSLYNPMPCIRCPYRCSVSGAGPTNLRLSNDWPRLPASALRSSSRTIVILYPNPLYLRLRSSLYHPMPCIRCPYRWCASGAGSTNLRLSKDLLKRQASVYSHALCAKLCCASSNRTSCAAAGPSSPTRQKLRLHWKA